MRLRVTLALLCSLFFATLATSAEACSFGRMFDGGRFSCTSKTLCLASPPERDIAKFRGATKGSYVAHFLDRAEKSHWYEISISTKQAARRAGVMRKIFSRRFGEFECTISVDEGVSHDCANSRSESGSCTICSKDSCKLVSYRVKKL